MRRYQITPVPAPRQNQGSRWNPKHQGAIARYHTFRDLVRLLGIVLPPRCFMRFEMPTPASFPERIGTPHMQRPDLDNLVKALLDAAAPQDAYIHEIRAEKVWAAVGAIIIGEIQ